MVCKLIATPTNLIGHYFTFWSIPQLSDMLAIKFEGRRNPKTVLAMYILRSMFPLYFCLKGGRMIKTPQTIDGLKIAYFATPLTNMRLSKPCKFHWSTRYHTYGLHVQQDGRVSVVTK